MAIRLQYLILTVFLAWLQVVAAVPPENEASLEGAGGLKVFVGRRGGAIRLYRELSPAMPNDGRQQDGDQKNGDTEDKRRPPPRSGEITVSFGRIQEVDSSSNAIATDNHGVKKPEDVDFTVTSEM